MNISKLAKKADIDVRHIECYADEEFEHNLNKFADLVVQDCINALKLGSDGYHIQDATEILQRLKAEQ